MNFEDIVDMDWLDSHTIEVVDPIIKEEIMDIHSLEEKIPLDYMPSTEQIKQLIELAKKQLALREQLVASCQLTTPEPESPTSINPNNIIKREVEGPISLETYAESDGIDIQKLTSKEKRQLRNKISARNFRVRRKEYITTLEGQVNEHKQENQDLLDKLNQIEEENKQLKIQLETLKCQNTQLLSSDSTYQDTSILVS